MAPIIVKVTKKRTSGPHSGVLPSRPRIMHASHRGTYIHTHWGAFAFASAVRVRVPIYTSFVRGIGRDDIQEDTVSDFRAIILSQSVASLNCSGRGVTKSSNRFRSITRTVFLAMPRQ